jgi:hypothetical protein
VRDKFAALMAEYPALRAEYDRAKAVPVAAVPSEPKEDAPPAPRTGSGSATPEPAKPSAAKPSAAGNGGSLGLIVGGVAGLLALAGVAAYFVLFRKPAPPPRRSSPAPLFDDQQG